MSVPGTTVNKTQGGVNNNNTSPHIAPKRRCISAKRAARDGAGPELWLPLHVPGAPQMYLHRRTSPWFRPAPHESSSQRLRARRQEREFRAMGFLPKPVAQDSAPIADGEPERA